MPNEVKIPKFAYPFKRKSNTATKTKSDQEIFEELLFQEQNTQYLFNKDGLFHGGVHVIAERFEMDFDVKVIRAIADGKLVAYRIDKNYLHNEVDGDKLLYNSSWMLLEHEMAYPATNKLKFYSLYMHMAAKCQYVFIYKLTDLVYKIKGKPKYARNAVANVKKNPNDKDVFDEAKDANGKPLVNKGDYVVVEEEPTTSKKKVKLLKVNEKSISDDVTVHKNNLEKVTVVTVTIKGNAGHLRPNFSKSPLTLTPPELLEAGTEIVVDKKVGTNGRHKVFRVGTTDRTDHVSIHKTDITPKEISPEDNGLVTKDMITDSFRPLTPPIEVKAGDILGKLGVYNTEWGDSELDKLIHLEVFTESIDELKTFISTATTEYAKVMTSLTDAEKKVRPKENRIYVPSSSKDDSIVRYGKEGYVYAKLTEADWLRDTTIKNTKTDKTLNILRVNKKIQKIKKDAIVRINPTKRKDNRYDVISVEEGDDDVQGVVSSDTLKKWSVWHKSIEIFHKFHEFPKEAESYYLDIFEPLEKEIVFKDKEGVKYQLVTKVSGSEIYVKKEKVVKTHGITFSNFRLIEKDDASAEKAGIFDDMEAFRDPESTKSQVEKEKLNKLFADILKKIKIDKDESGGLEAGELAGLSLTKPKRDELSHFIVEHTSEWHKDNEERTKVLKLLEKLANKLEDVKKKKVSKEKISMIQERIETLSFFPKNPTLAFIHPIALVEGFVGGGGLITKEMLNAICSGSGNNQELLDALNKYCPQYEINTPLRIAHFLSQTAHECDCFSDFEENTGYRESIAMKNSCYKKYRLGVGKNITLATKTIKGKIVSFCKQPEYFNCKYQSNNGNGKASTGDGYKYRGRGMIQLTGRDTYTRYKNDHNRRNPDDIQDFVTSPDLVATSIKYTVASACSYWYNKSALGKKLSAYADEGATELNVQKVGAVINGWHDKDKDGTPNKPNGHSDRWTKFQAVAKIIGAIK